MPQDVKVRGPHRRMSTKYQVLSILAGRRSQVHLGLGDDTQTGNLDAYSMTRIRVFLFYFASLIYTTQKRLGVLWDTSKFEGCCFVLKIEIRTFFC